MPVFNEKYYTAVRPYMPERAKQVLDEQIPAIKQQVDQEIDAFAKSFSENLIAEYESFTKDAVADLQSETESLVAQMKELEASLGDSQKVTEATAKLKSAMEAHENKISAFGTTLNKAAKGALTVATSAVGLPIKF